MKAVLSSEADVFDRVADPDILVGSGYVCRIRIFLSGPGMFVGSGYFCQIRRSWSIQDPGNLVRFGDIKIIEKLASSRVTDPDPDILVGSG